jgi:MerR family transcriptional regulator, repressor of the yfmOP operon
MSTMLERTHRIGEVAEQVGVTTRTIRYYEELGLLGTDGGNRTKGSHRLYTDADIGRLAELVRLRELLGLSLEELTALADTGQARAALRAQWAGTSSDDEREAIIMQSIPLVERQLELVGSRRQKLDEFAAELSAKLQTLHAEQRQLRRSASR